MTPKQHPAREPLLVDGPIPEPVISLAGGVLPFAGRRDAVQQVARVVDGAALVLLLLSAGMLIFRPPDLIPALSDTPIYQWLMAACIACAAPRIVQRLAAKPLDVNAATLLVFLLIPAVMLSHLAHANTYDARIGGLEMAKACMFFLLVLTIVDTLDRLRTMLLALAAAVLAITVLSLLQYHDLLRLPVEMAVQQNISGSDEPATLLRLCGIGVFHDPNDFALVLVLAGCCCMHAMGEIRWSRFRWALLAVVPVFGYALMLTHSRGGLMAAVAAGTAYMSARLGWRNVLPLLCLLIPLLLWLIPGRQTDFNLGDPQDTFQTRIDLWGESLNAFRSAPLLGIGQGKLVDVIGFVTHNSYLHAFAELGLFGGIIFIGAFYLLGRGTWSASPADPQAARLRPYIFAIFVGYAAGLLSLSRCYTVPTQLVLGLAAAYVSIAARLEGITLPKLDLRCMQRITAVGLVFLAAIYIFIRISHAGLS